MQLEEHADYQIRNKLTGLAAGLAAAGRYCGGGRCGRVFSAQIRGELLTCGGA